MAELKGRTFLEGYSDRLSQLGIKRRDFQLLLDKIDSLPATEVINRCWSELRGLVDEARSFVEEKAREQELETTWGSREELEALVSSITERLESRGAGIFFDALIDALESGRIQAEVWKQRRCEDDHRAALSELRERRNRATEALPPGTEPGETWLDWIWSRTDEQRGQLFANLHGEWPRLVAFLDSCRGAWRPSDERALAEESEPTSPQEGSLDHLLGEREEPELIITELEEADEAPDEEGREASLADLEREPDGRNEEDEVGAAGPSSFPDPGTAGRDAPDALLGRSSSTRVQKIQADPRYRVRDLDTKLLSFEAYRDAFWIRQDGSAVSAPWKEESFRETLHKRQLEALKGRDFARLELFARAAKELECCPVCDPQDVRMFAALWSGQELGAIGTSDAVEVLQDFLAEEAPKPGPFHRLKLGAALLFPGESRLQRHVLEALIPQLRFRMKALAEFLRGALELRALNVAVLPRLRAALGGTKQRSREELKALLRQRRKQLHSEFVRLYSAAGGVVQRTHCRKAWNEFVERAKPILRPLFPEDKGGQDSWSSQQMERKVGGLVAMHEEIADRGGAKHKDRGKMNATAELLAELAGQVNSVREEIEALEDPQRGRDSRELPLQEAHRLLEETGSESAEEAFLCEVLKELLSSERLGAGKKRGRSSFGAEDFLEFPGLIAFVSSLSKEDVGDTAEWLDASDLSDPVRASATLILEVPQKNTSSVSGQESVEKLRLLLSDLDRIDLLSHLAEALDSRNLRKRVRASFHDLESRLRQEVRELGRAARELAHLSEPQSDALQRASEDMEGLLDASGSDLFLIRAWVGALKEHAFAMRDLSVERLKKEIEVMPPGPHRTRALGAIREGQYQQAELLSRQVEPEDDVRPQRETLFRWEAESKVKAPRQALRELKDSIGEHETKATVWLVEKWLDSRQVAVRLGRYVFSSGRRASKGSSKKETLDDKASETQQNRYAIECGDIRSWFQRDGRNPTFIPQLRKFSRLRILNLRNTKPTDSKFVKRALEEIVQHSDHGNTLCVVPAPLLPSKTREAFLREVHGRSDLSAAILDDLDLWRLLDLEKNPDPMLGLLEIALEQQPLRKITPFTGGEGQHIYVEMFVGRRDDASDLATTPTYTQLFSGRKLGKSSLLQFVRESWNGKHLPSGNTLRVLYVPIVGDRAEVQIVDKILQELKRELGFQAKLREGLRVSAKLTKALEQFCDKRPDESLLIVLDEADSFKESQLKRFRDDKESCLSFQMRSQIQRATDRSGLPRIRFVFAGYRTTHRTDGTWANWGRVLKLNPLEPEDATRLVEGPLARLGIDARTCAPIIADRCGFQPAVILTFGRRLIEEIDPRSRAYRAGPKVVSSEDVDAAFNHQSVKEEIHTVTRSNFQGNPLGLILFMALLAEFHELPPRAVVAQPELVVLDRLKLIGGENLAWIYESQSQRTEEAAGAIIRQNLTEFAERNLIRLERDENRHHLTCALRFPHHLPIVLGADHENEIRSLVEIHEREQQNAQNDEKGTPSVIGQAAMRDIEFALSNPEWAKSQAAILVCSLWREGVEDHSGGIAPMLGMSRAEILLADELSGRLGWESQKRLVVFGASPGCVVPILDRRPKDRSPALVTGGIDLLRWALEHSGSETFELQAHGRLPYLVLKWWFREVRGYEFPPDVPDPIEQISAMTSGIPYAVGQCDEAFKEVVGGTGESVSGEQWMQIRQAVEERLKGAATALRKGPSSIRLIPREIQLLKMAALIAAEAPDSNVLDDMKKEAWSTLYQEAWSPVYGQRPFPPAFDPTDETDRLAIEVLLKMGLLPPPDQIVGVRNLESLPVFKSGDYAIRLARDL